MESEISKQSVRESLKNNFCLLIRSFVFESFKVLKKAVYSDNHILYSRKKTARIWQRTHSFRSEIIVLCYFWQCVESFTQKIYNKNFDIFPAVQPQNGCVEIHMSSRYGLIMSNRYGLIKVLTLIFSCTSISNNLLLL